MSEGDRGSSKKSEGGPMNPKVPELINELLEDVVIPPLLYGCGYSRAELDAPRIGIANTWTDLNPGHVHLDRIADLV
jgi:dihydroxy-acid dehydratase